jgi:hypothetical protein
MRLCGCLSCTTPTAKAAGRAVRGYVPAQRWFQHLATLS